MNSYTPAVFISKFRQSSALPGCAAGIAGTAPYPIPSVPVAAYAANRPQLPLQNRFIPRRFCRAFF